MNFINGTDSLPAAKHNSALRKETPSSAVQPTAQPTKDVIRVVATAHPNPPTGPIKSSGTGENAPVTRIILLLDRAYIHTIVG
jgi:hypothetical protein